MLALALLIAQAVHLETHTGVIQLETISYNGQRGFTLIKADGTELRLCPFYWNAWRDGEAERQKQRQERLLEGHAGCHVKVTGHRWPQWVSWIGIVAIEPIKSGR